jgi:hypothetical protein
MANLSSAIDTVKQHARQSERKAAYKQLSASERTNMAANNPGRYRALKSAATYKADYRALNNAVNKLYDYPSKVGNKSSNGAKGNLTKLAEQLAAGINKATTPYRPTTKSGRKAMAEYMGANSKQKVFFPALRKGEKISIRKGKISFKYGSEKRGFIPFNMLALAISHIPENPYDVIQEPNIKTECERVSKEAQDMKAQALYIGVGKYIWGNASGGNLVEDFPSALLATLTMWQMQYMPDKSISSFVTGVYPVWFN